MLVTQEKEADKEPRWGLNVDLALALIIYNLIH